MLKSRTISPYSTLLFGLRSRKPNRGAQPPTVVLARETTFDGTHKEEAYHLYTATADPKAPTQDIETTY
jgi:hypothetical protein